MNQLIKDLEIIIAWPLALMWSLIDVLFPGLLNWFNRSRNVYLLYVFFSLSFIMLAVFYLMFAFVLRRILRKMDSIFGLKE